MSITITPLTCDIVTHTHSIIGSIWILIDIIWLGANHSCLDVLVGVVTSQCVRSSTATWFRSGINEIWNTWWIDIMVDHWSCSSGARVWFGYCRGHFSSNRFRSRAVSDPWNDYGGIRRRFDRFIRRLKFIICWTKKMKLGQSLLRLMASSSIT